MSAGTFLIPADSGDGGYLQLGSQYAPFVSPSGTVRMVSNGTQALISANGGAYAAMVTVQATTPGTVQTGNINLSGTGRFGTRLVLGADIGVGKASFATTTGVGESFGSIIRNVIPVSDTVSKTGLLADSWATHTSGTITEMIALNFGVNANGSGGTTTNAYALYSTASVGTGATIGSRYGAKIFETSGAGTLTNQYGLYIENLTKAATLNYAIYTAGTTPSYFGGSVGVGVAPATGVTLEVNGTARFDRPGVPSQCVDIINGSVYNQIRGVSVQTNMKPLFVVASYTAGGSSAGLNSLYLGNGAFGSEVARLSIGPTGGVSIGSSYATSDPGDGYLIVPTGVGIGTTTPIQAGYVMHGKTATATVATGLQLTSSYSGVADTFLGDFGDYGMVLSHDREPMVGTFVNSAVSPNQARAVGLVLGGYLNTGMFSIGNYPSGAYTPRLIVDWSGNVGIGAGTANALLDVRGKMRLGDDSANNYPADSPVLYFSSATASVVANFTSMTGSSGGAQVILRANGTGLATAMAAGNWLGLLGFRGKDNAGLIGASSATIRAEAGEAWSTTAHGTVIVIATTPNGSVTRADQLTVDGGGNIILGAAALATNATDGFLFIPTCAGPPTGVPSVYTDRVPIVFDSVNKFLYVYLGAWKKSTVYA